MSRAGIKERVRVLALVLWCVLSWGDGAVLAQVNGCGGGVCNPLLYCFNPSYTGPGDAEPGASDFESCARAYNAAYASSGGVACIVRRASDNTTINLNVLPAGFVNIAPVLAFCASTTCFVTQANDQTLANVCSAAPCNLTQATQSKQPQLLFNCYNGWPCLVFAGGQFLANSSLTTIAQPFTFSFVAQRTGAYTSYGSVLSNTGGQVQTGFANAANEVFAVASGSVPTEPALDGSFHAVGIVLNGASTAIAVDGGYPATINPGSASLTSGLVWGAGSLSSNYATAESTEVGVWPSNIGATGLGLINANQQAFY